MVSIEIWLYVVVRALQRLEVRDSGQDQERPAAAVLPKEDVRVQAVAHHADLRLIDSVAASTHVREKH